MSVEILFYYNVFKTTKTFITFQIICSYKEWYEKLYNTSSIGIKSYAESTER